MGVASFQTNALAALQRLDAMEARVRVMDLTRSVPTIELERAPPKHALSSVWVMIRSTNTGRAAKRVAFINNCQVFWWEDYR